MDETYTKRLEIEIWNMAKELDENEDFSKVTEFLNSEEGFQPFGKRLAIFIAKKLDIDSTDRKTVVQALNEACGKTGVGLSEIASDNTFRNWFDKDIRPKKGDDSRRFSMFALAFSLRLSVDDTKKLFHKIFLDRAFNYRNEKEVIYYFCLKNNKSWADAKRMIAEVESMTIDTSDHTQLTNVIVQNVDVMSDEKMLLAYIRENGHNFEKNSVNASKIFNRYLSEAKNWAKDEISRYALEHQNKWIKNLSNNTLYETITGLNITGKKGTKTVFSNANLPKEIKTRFPEAASFGKKHLTSEEYRKIIILLFSYGFWYQVQLEEIDGGIDDYTDELNYILFDCNYSGLYYGNSFDWLFLFCTQAEQPLDLFRELLAEVLA